MNARNSARDSYPSSPSNGAPTPPSIDDTCLSSQPVQVPLAHLQVPQTNVIWSAHYGYVYCMALLPSIREGSDDPPVNDSEELRLVTGSGDATVKVETLVLSRIANAQTDLSHRCGPCRQLAHHFSILLNVVKEQFSL